MVKLTLKLRLSGSASAFAALRETSRAYTESFNRVAQVAFSMSRNNGTELHKLTYRSECDISGLPSQLICSARIKALEAAKSAKEKIKKGKRASCPQSKDARIRYDARSATIKLKEGTVTLATKKKRQAFTFHVPEYAKDRTDLKVCSSDLVERKEKYYLHVVLEHPTPDVIETNRVVGVDLGVVRPAVTSEAQFLGERRWREVQNRSFRLRRELQAKGTRSAKRKLKKLSKRENGFRKDCDHVLSKQIALSVPAGSTLVLEDLTHIRERMKGSKETQRRLHGWSFHRFLVFLSYKCQLAGVKVVLIDPAYTSQECSRCGFTSKKNRKSQSQFECKQCGVRLNADLNAARVIRKREQAERGKTALCGPHVNGPIASAHNQSETVTYTESSLVPDASCVL